MCIYECDPDRNPECRKTQCYRRAPELAFDQNWDSCRATTKPECARLDKDGNPIVIGQDENDILVRNIDRDRLGKTIGDLERISVVGIVNAKKDMGAIADAIEMLRILQRIW